MIKYIKGFSKEVQDLAIVAIKTADTFGIGRISNVENELRFKGFDGIANNEKLLDELVFKLGEIL